MHNEVNATPTGMPRVTVRGNCCAASAAVAGVMKSKVPDARTSAKGLEAKSPDREAEARTATFFRNKGREASFRRSDIKEKIVGRHNPTSSQLLWQGRLRLGPGLVTRRWGFKSSPCPHFSRDMGRTRRVRPMEDPGLYSGDVGSNPTPAALFIPMAGSSNTCARIGRTPRSWRCGFEPRPCPHFSRDRCRTGRDRQPDGARSGAVVEVRSVRNGRHRARLVRHL